MRRPIFFVRGTCRQRVRVYVQRESPGKDKESNWLPAPEGGFVLMMRLYWPKEKPPSILDGTWKPPEVKQVS